MSFDVIATDPFERKFKRLSKKYSSLRTDIAEVINSLEENPTFGTPIGKDCYKIRVSYCFKRKR